MPTGQPGVQGWFLLSGGGCSSPRLGQDRESLQGGCRWLPGCLVQLLKQQLGDAVQACEKVTKGHRALRDQGLRGPRPVRRRGHQQQRRRPPGVFFMSSSWSQACRALPFELRCVRILGNTGKAVGMFTAAAGAVISLAGRLCERAAPAERDSTGSGQAGARVRGGLPPGHARSRRPGRVLARAPPRPGSARAAPGSVRARRPRRAAAAGGPAPAAAGPGPAYGVSGPQRR